MGKIHWVGTGLSSIPGLRRLAKGGQELCVWNRSLEKAKSLVGDLTKEIYKFDIKKLESHISNDDIIVSMLPGEWHVPMAKLGIDRGAHFVSSSYISEEMAALHSSAVEKNLSLVNEVGLDPGIDHLMAHYLVNDYKNSQAYDPGNEIEFFSYCGGIPKNPNKFCYKFSWSPTGVLKALKSPARSIKNFKELITERPWHQVEEFSIQNEDREIFEVYPNRDSLPFIKQYNFPNDWKVKTFVRGTLRNMGWEKAWQEVFAQIDALDIEKEFGELQNLSKDLWERNAYKKDEPDRVVLTVSLRASKERVTIYDKSYLLDAWGDKRGTAMSRLVSQPVSLAVEAIDKSEIAPGISAAPQSSKLVNQWLEKIGKEAQTLRLIQKV